LQMPPLRVKIQLAPAFELSLMPPMIAVLPSADIPTDQPCDAPPTASVATSFDPCWLQTPPLRVYIQAAPTPLLSFGPPTMAVLPSADSATEVACQAFPTAPVPTSLLPCCVNCASAGCESTSSMEQSNAAAHVLGVRSNNCQRRGMPTQKRAHRVAPPSNM